MACKSVKKPRFQYKPKPHIAACDYCSWERGFSTPKESEVAAVEHGLRNHPYLCKNDPLVVAYIKNNG